MKAIQVDQIHKNVEEAIKSLRIVEKPMPKPKPGEVLVKIEAAPCNPADLLFLQGKYGVKKALPAVPGWEGAGTVVESGGGILGWSLKGKKVACGGKSSGDGTWAEYYIANAKACIPLNKEIPIQQGATLIINPFTAVGLVEKAKKEGHLAIIQTAALSQVGRMMQVLAKQKGIPVINIVRRKEQIEELENSETKWALNSEEDEFLEKLKDLAGTLKATIAFDAVAGEMTGKILGVMPPKSKAVVYGALSEQSCCGITPLGLIFEQKKIEGFWLSQWIKERRFWQIYQTTRFLQELIESGVFKTKIRDSAGFEDWKEALLNYQQKMTLGKVMLNPF